MAQSLGEQSSGDSMPAIDDVWRKSCLILVSETQTGTNDNVLGHGSPLAACRKVSQRQSICQNILLLLSPQPQSLVSALLINILAQHRGLLSRKLNQGPGPGLSQGRSHTKATV